MTDIKIYLKGWHDGAFFRDAVNDDLHPLHEEAMAVHRQSYRPYERGDLVYLAAEYTEPTVGDLDLCEQAFERFNIGDDPIAVGYRRDGNRSLSIGDVVVVDGRAYSVASVGFERIEEFR